MSYSSGKSVQVLLVLLVVSCVVLQSGNAARRFFRSRLSGEELNKPFVLLYEHENFRGKEFVQYISKACVNLPEDYQDWASSADTHRTCASVCVTENCSQCQRVYSSQGISKLRIIGLNDKIKSVKSCF